MREIASVKKWVTDFEAAENAFKDLQVLAEFAEAGDDPGEDYDSQFKAALSKVEDLEFKNMLGDEEDLRCLCEEAARRGIHVLLDGEALPHYLHRKKYEDADRGWYYSQTLKSVQIKYRNPKHDHEVTVSFAVFDLIGM